MDRLWLRRLSHLKRICFALRSYFVDHFHGNRSLAIIGFTEAREVERYGGICGLLLNGPYPVGELGEMAEAHLLVIDSVGALDETARHVTPKSAWLGKSLSVVDGDSGPDAIENHPQKDKIRSTYQHKFQISGETRLISSRPTNNCQRDSDREDNSNPGMASPSRSASEKTNHLSN